MLLKETIVHGTRLFHFYFKTVQHYTGFVFVGLYPASTSTACKVLTATQAKALPALQTSCYIGSIQLTSQEWWE